MKAAVHARYGPPEVVRISEVPLPTAGDRDVLVRVHAADREPDRLRLPGGEALDRPVLQRAAEAEGHDPGQRVRRQVDAVGPGVRSFAVGDRVFGLSEPRFGAHAEYLVVPEDGPIATIPANVAFDAIAPSTEGSHYALSLITKTKMPKGNEVLVNGGTGAIGRRRSRS